MSTLTVDTLTNQEARMATAWVNFNGIGTISIRDQYNVSSITDNGVGDYSIVYSNPLSNPNYAVALATTGFTEGSLGGGIVIRGNATNGASHKTSTGNRIQLFVNTTALGDSHEVNVITLGGQA